MDDITLENKDSVVGYSGAAVELEIVVGDTVYYLPNPDGSIGSFARWKFDSEALEALEPIVPGYDGRYYFESQCPEKPLEEMQAEVRAVRNSYLEKYVDPKQLVLVWESLSVDERNIYSDYRRYLLDYTDNEDWHLSNPMTLDEYLVANENTIDNTLEKGDTELLIV